VKLGNMILFDFESQNADLEECSFEILQELLGEQIPLLPEQVQAKMSLSYIPSISQ